MKNRKKEVAKFFAGFEAFHALVHGYLLVSGTTLTVFGITTTPTLNAVSTIVNAIIAVAISGAFTGVGLLMQWQNIAAPYGRIVPFAIAIVAGGWFILPKALRAVRQLSLDMNVLMTVAVIGAALIGEWSEGAAVVFHADNSRSAAAMASPHGDAAALGRKQRSSTFGKYPVWLRLALPDFIARRAMVLCCVAASLSARSHLSHPDEKRERPADPPRYSRFHLEGR